MTVVEYISNFNLFKIGWVIWSDYASPDSLRWSIDQIIFIYIYSIDFLRLYAYQLGTIFVISSVVNEKNVIDLNWL